MNSTEEDNLRQFINDSIATNNIEILCELILQLKKDYTELAKLSTLGYYKEDWTHSQVLNYITYET